MNILMNIYITTQENLGILTRKSVYFCKCLYCFF